MTREIVRSEYRAIKLGVTESTIGSVRTQTEDQTAVRIMDGKHIGLASACARADIDALTRQATDALVFGIPCTADPGCNTSLSVEHAGSVRDVDELVGLTEGVLEQLRADFRPCSHGVEQQGAGGTLSPMPAGSALPTGRTQVASSPKKRGQGTSSTPSWAGGANG